jgi:hypothetical protein
MADLLDEDGLLAELAQLARREMDNDASVNNKEMIVDDNEDEEISLLAQALQEENFMSADINYDVDVGAMDGNKAGGFDKHDDEIELLEILKKAASEKKHDPIEQEIRRLEAELARERARAEAALERAADLYAQRFVLATICAASVPPLGFALLAHRYEMHEWEARSDIVGIMLVACIILLFLARTLWKRARSQIVEESSALIRNDVREGDVNLEHNGGKFVPVADTGLRKRHIKKPVEELVL